MRTKETINIECCREGSKQEAPLERSLEGGGLPEEAKLEKKKNDIQQRKRKGSKVGIDAMFGKWPGKGDKMLGSARNGIRKNGEAFGWNTELVFNVMLRINYLGKNKQLKSS